MRSRAGFTLLEVLLALVLLATVVGVSVPYLRADTGADPTATESRFHAVVARAVAMESRSHASALTYEAYADVAAMNGWECRRIARAEPDAPAGERFGEWLLITDGIHRSVQWARIPEGPGTTP